FSSRRRHTRSTRDWSSDVCSSDLSSSVGIRSMNFAFGGIEGTVEVASELLEDGLFRLSLRVENRSPGLHPLLSCHALLAISGGEIGRASCRERVWIWVVARRLRDA